MHFRSIYFVAKGVKSLIGFSKKQLFTFFVLVVKSNLVIDIRFHLGIYQCNPLAIIFHTDLWF